MIISKDKSSDWNISLINRKLHLFNNNESIITPIEITEEDYIVLKEKKANKESSLESEYKFLVKNNDWESQFDKKESYKQLYLTKDINKWQSRLRIINDEKAFLTIKGPRVGISNIEVEYPLDIKEAFMLWNMHNGVRLSKTRYNVLIENEKWEVDVFDDPELNNLILAEIEVPTSTTKINNIPNWIGKEVTDNPYFRNDTLADYIYNEKQNKNTYSMKEEVGKLLTNKNKFKY